MLRWIYCNRLVGFEKAQIKLYVCTHVSSLCLLIHHLSVFSYSCHLAPVSFVLQCNVGTEGQESRCSASASD